MSKKQASSQQTKAPEKPRVSNKTAVSGFSMDRPSVGMSGIQVLNEYPYFGTSRQHHQASVMRMQQQQGNTAVQRYLTQPKTFPPKARPNLVAPGKTLIQKFDPRYHRQALVDGLVGTGFSDEEIGQMYAANWERDFSQAHPALAAIVLAWKQVKMAASQSRLTEEKIKRFEGTVDKLVNMIPFRINELMKGKAYQGYSFYEHMDNPTAGMSGEAKESMLRRPEGEVIPQYMADSREYIKAQLFRAARLYRGDMNKQGDAGQTAEAFRQRTQAIAQMIPTEKATPGSIPATVIADETTQQAQRTPVTQVTFQEGDQITAPTPNGLVEKRNRVSSPTSGPAFNMEVDRRFWAKTQYKVGQRLDPNLNEDKPYVRIWLQIRNEVRAERQQLRPIQLPPQVVKGKQPLNPAGRWNRDVADAMGRASHALEDFFAHSNFVEIAIGELTPSTELATGTFDSVDEKHALAHKIRALADEIEREIKLVNLLAGRRDKNPDSSEMNKEINPSEGSVKTGLEGVGIILGHTIAGGKIGKLVGNESLGRIYGLRIGIKSTIRNVIATPKGVQFLRNASEKLEEDSLKNSKAGSHTQLAKDQPGHEEDTAGKSKTNKFRLAQELAATANRLILGQMRQVLDIGSPDSAEYLLLEIYKVLDEIIAPPSGNHPLNHIYKKWQQE